MPECLTAALGNYWQVNLHHRLATLTREEARLHHPGLKAGAYGRALSRAPVIAAAEHQCCCGNAILAFFRFNLCRWQTGWIRAHVEMGNQVCGTVIFIPASSSWRMSYYAAAIYSSWQASGSCRIDRRRLPDVCNHTPTLPARTAGGSVFRSENAPRAYQLSSYWLPDGLFHAATSNKPSLTNMPRFFCGVDAAVIRFHPAIRGHAAEQRWRRPVATKQGMFCVCPHRGRLLTDFVIHRAAITTKCQRSSRIPLNAQCCLPQIGR